MQFRSIALSHVAHESIAVTFRRAVTFRATCSRIGNRNTARFVQETSCYLISDGPLTGRFDQITRATFRTIPELAWTRRNISLRNTSRDLEWIRFHPIPPLPTVRIGPFTHSYWNISCLSLRTSQIWANCPSFSRLLHFR